LYATAGLKNDAEYRFEHIIELHIQTTLNFIEFSIYSMQDIPPVDLKNNATVFRT
jgi:hypothetical protein